MGGLVLGIVGEELRKVTWGLSYTYDYISLHMIAWALTCQRLITYLYKPIHARGHVHGLLHSNPHAHMLPATEHVCA